MDTVTQTAVQYLEVLSYCHVVAPSKVYVQVDTSTLSPTLQMSECLVWLLLSSVLLCFHGLSGGHPMIMLSETVLFCCSPQAWPGPSQSPAIPTPMRW